VREAQDCLTGLPPTEALLVAGGDERIVADPLSGLSRYGCGVSPDPDLVALGSSTASVISTHAYKAAQDLRDICQRQLQDRPAAAVYATQMQRIRAELLQLCGIAPGDGVSAVLAASGTDLHMLAGQWIKPQRIVMIAAGETGRGVPAALQGRHFGACTAFSEEVATGAPLGDQPCELVTLSPRDADGSLRDPARVDAECNACVSEAASAGKSVLLVLTDVSKTGLIVPGIASVLALKKRWPSQVEILVDACQFRLAPATLHAYLSHGCMLAVTGSKFISGPTFCGALLIPAEIGRRYRDLPLDAGLRAYSCAGDWPPDWPAARALPDKSNFGLLLRWQAALTELRRFCAVPDALADAFVHDFGEKIRQRLAADACFEALPVAPLERHALGSEERWDRAQTIFSFLLFMPDERGGRRPLHRDETQEIYRGLMRATAGNAARRFQLGQPVACGQRGNTPVSALRICISARMIVAACAADSTSTAAADAIAALDAIKMALATT